MFKNFDELPISLSVVQAAEVLGVSDVSLYHLIKTDKTFPVINIGRRMTVPNLISEKEAEKRKSNIVKLNA